jgi:hypothetical protein
MPPGGAIGFPALLRGMLPEEKVGEDAEARPADALAAAAAGVTGIPARIDTMPTSVATSAIGDILAGRPIPSILKYDCSEAVICEVGRNEPPL